MKTKFLLLGIILSVSFATSGQFQRDRKIIAAEYFVNVDPGLGKGTSIDIGSTPLVEITAEIKNLTNPVGSKIFVRFKSSNNTWSGPMCITKKEYFPNQGATLKYSEYFINQDPGIGKATPITYDSEGKVILKSLPVIRGDRVYVRFRDSYNRWSPARPMQFNFKEIDRAEYSLKQYLGDTIYPKPMVVNPTNLSSSIYTIQPTLIDRSLLLAKNYVYVRFQTKEKFYSPWYREQLITSIPGIKTDEDLTIYPNPFKESFFIEFQTRSGLKSVRTEISDITGRILIIHDEKSNSQGLNRIAVDAVKLPPGIYFCSLYLDGMRTDFTKIMKL